VRASAVSTSAIYRVASAAGVSFRLTAPGKLRSASASGHFEQDGAYGWSGKTRVHSSWVRRRPARSQAACSQT
jgi:hypothetical protein